ncbi:hypothetical protein [Microvirga sp. TS319]|uniref:hypothetical protein n=1 Tax=Microvirga sp. TS319 TaxID=3241165 RepID=UPI003519EEEE
MMLKLPQERLDAFDVNQCSRWAGCSQALAEQLSNAHRFAIQCVRLRIFDTFEGQKGEEEAFWSVLLGLTGQDRVPFCPQHTRGVIGQFERLRAIRLNNKKLIRFNPQTDIILIEIDPRQAARRICALAWGENGTILDMVSCLIPSPSNPPKRLSLPRHTEEAASFPPPIPA